MPTLEDTSPLSPFASSLPEGATLESLLEKVLAENSHAKVQYLRILRTEVFEQPFEEGTNIGEIELELNGAGNRATYGVYTTEPAFRCFAN